LSWAIGFDSKWNRDIGYGVPAYCDHPGCGKEIDRGLSYVCGSEPYGGDRGCGLYFCLEHMLMPMSDRLPGQLCHRCYPRIKNPYVPSKEHPDWIKWKLSDPSWARWRRRNPIDVARMKKEGI